MLQALCVRVAMGMMLVPVEICLFAVGEARYAFYQNIWRSVWVLVGVPLVWPIWGLVGVVWVTATSEIPSMFILWRPFIRARLLRLSREAMALGLFAAGIALGWVADLGVRTAAQHFGVTF